MTERAMTERAMTANDRATPMTDRPATTSPDRALTPAVTPDPLAPLADIRCDVDVVLGTGVLTLRECLVLQRDHIVKLAEPAGGDLQIRVQGITMATGEVVVVDDAAALRVTHILPPAGVEAA
jgi:flagellar motor switch/type III secretory pathway protein FliN